MNHIVVIALGGAFGAVFRFLISSGVYLWLGRGFPYGTLVVNVIGSLLMGLMVEALTLQRVALSMEYRAAILVGFFGSLTTFATFSLDTFYLIEQGQLAKASLNVTLNVLVCIFAVWTGLIVGKFIFSYSTGAFILMDWIIPYALLTVNAIVSLLIGMISTVLLSKASLPLEYGAAIVMVTVGIFVTLSSLYLVHFFIEHGYSFNAHLKSILAGVLSNIMLCSAALWVGFLTGKQF